MTSTIIMKRPALSIKKQFLAIILGCAFAVVLPQFFHLIGKLTGTGSQLAALFSPMHFPVILVGLIGGPFVGAVSGFLAPIVNFMLTGMPVASKLPLMVIEVFGYGLCAGILRNFTVNNFVKVFITMIFGRLLRFLAVVFLVAAFKEKMDIFSIWLSIPRCWPGILLQMILIPLMVYKFDSNSEIK